MSHLLHSLILQAQETTLLSITSLSLQTYWSSWNSFKISLCIQHSFPSFSVPVATSYIMSLKNTAIRFEFPASSFSTNSTQFRCPSSTLCNSQISLILKGLQLSPLLAYLSPSTYSLGASHLLQLLLPVLDKTLKLFLLAFLGSHRCSESTSLSNSTPRFTLNLCPSNHLI